jgi:hypothetical protein
MYVNRSNNVCESITRAVQSSSEVTIPCHIMTIISVSSKSEFCMNKSINRLTVILIGKTIPANALYFKCCLCLSSMEMMVMQMMKSNINAAVALLV